LGKPGCFACLLMVVSLATGCGTTDISPFGGPDITPPSIVEMWTDGELINIVADEPVKLRIQLQDISENNYFFVYCGNRSYVSTFEFSIPGLNANTEYSFSANVEDRTGNTSASDLYTFVASGDQTSVLRVTMIVVGWGDSHLIEMPSGGSILIDGARWDRWHRVTSFLAERGIEHVDHMVLTHLHSDHYSGLSERLIQQLNPDDFYDAEPHAPSYEDDWPDENIQSLLEYYQVTEKNPTEGEYLDWDDEVTTRVLCSGNRWISENNENHSSIVLMLSMGEIDIILTGDAEVPNEDFMRSKYGYELEAEVLKVGHHGNDDATSLAFAKAVSPLIALVPIDPADVEYAMPDREVIDNLTDVGADLFYSFDAVPFGASEEAIDGHVEVITDGIAITVKIHPR